MIKIEHTQVTGWEAAIRGLRNPKNSWDRSDSSFYGEEYGGTHGACDNVDISPSILLQVGNNDSDLMLKLAKGGPVHAKFRRMIVVYTDITAPTYWWAELDTYKVGTVRNSCSFMHKGTSKPFEIVDFSFDGLEQEGTYETFMDAFDGDGYKASEFISDLDCTWANVIGTLNDLRELYLKTKDDRIFQMIRRLLPSGYNIKATMMMNYEVLSNIYHWRKNHRLDEWRELCKWIETLPESWIITGKGEENEA